MDPAVVKLLQRETVAAALEAFGFETGFEPTLIAKNENFVYQAVRDASPAIVRLTHSGRRSRGMIQGELDWIALLHDSGVSVHRPYHSRNGKLVESFDAGDGTQFHAAAFSYAAGQLAWKAMDPWSEQVTLQWGRALGAMHRISSQCAVAGKKFFRPDFDDPCFRDGMDSLRARDPQLFSEYHAAIARVASLPRTDDGFGLVHTDLHPGNFFVDSAGITCIDFDDCAYHYFAHDIAMPLYYDLLFVDADLEDRAHRLFATLMRGYLQESWIDPQWMETIPLFLNLRTLDLMHVLHFWEVDPSNRWVLAVRSQYQNGHPMRDFPWRKWLNDILQSRSQ